jgi:hypothetical protein
MAFGPRPAIGEGVYANLRAFGNMSLERRLWNGGTGAWESGGEFV